MQPGYILGGRYQIIRALGEGGMANVYLAHDRILDRDVSVKLLRLDLRDDPHTIKRFHREAKAASELISDNIVAVLDAGEENGTQFLVMEYVNGTDLKQYIKKHFPIPYQEVINIMEQILAGVKAAHRQGIIHRDLKPQNILINRTGLVKITDFGIAIALSEHALTQTNTVLGSVHYLSPEQARGGMATCQSDIYSLGIILYEMLTGSVPFEGETAVSIALKHFKNEVPSVREFDRRIPQALENVVLKATAKQPSDRYESVEDMADDLSSALAPSRSDEPKYRPQPNDDGETKVISSAAITEELSRFRQSGASIADSAEISRDDTRQNHKKKKRPNRHPRRRRFAIFVGVLFFLFCGVVIGLALSRPQMGTVPEVNGASLTTAKHQLENQHLRTGKIHYLTNEKVAKGRIIKTEPVSGTELRQDTTVGIWLSSGPKKIKLANYIGKNYAMVAAELEAEGVTVDRELLSSSTVAAGRIIQQDVPDGKRVFPKKTTVHFTVSSGYKEITLPDLSGKTKSEAQQFADQNALNITYQYQYSSDVEKDRVISQKPGSEAVVREGGELAVVISKGVQKKDDKTDSFTVNVTVPFSANETSSSSTSSGSNAASSSENVVQVYIRDSDHSMNSVYRQLTISKATEVSIPYTVATGKTAGYKIVRDGKTVMQDNNLTADSH
ncbi:Stk1 family PASTA domain-containing Ser/Thr kinase [Levilactobacillus bambusae]|uniref:non-specific serine/threonine protein kinase n=1 Tax=Levilactobacillus bambusae TaxID=2024736 RepID=A0A2V1N4W2_9LACO|nr:Stk1 family PASTA domain-containing Ser/Thr kinase [Levilactobacillus bambusae]PWG00916.1 Stk1 family PASTA domain-containing Ser/Thr kinase [Levilactobacillus bambusae]